MDRNYVICGIAVLALAGTISGQNHPHKTSTKKSAPSAAAVRGKEVFARKCAVCHNSDSNVKKIGPGLKGISKRGTFTVNDNKVTDASLTTWIENGDSLMPPFKDTLEPAQIHDVVAFVKTL